MASTKIINISKGDDFEEVFDLFKNTEAGDIILIFPKGSRFAKQEQYFEALKEEADSSGKNVSVMSTDPVVIEFSSKYNFDILEPPSSGRRRREAAPVSEVPASEVPEKQLSEEQPLEEQLPEPLYFGKESFNVGRDEEEFGGEKPEAVLTAAGADDKWQEAGQGRMIKDILPNRADRNLEIKEEKERVFKVDIRSRIERPESPGADIEKIWAEGGRGERRNFLADFNLIKKLKPLRFFKKIPLLLIVGAALVLILILFTTLGNARIIIHPQQQKLDFELKVSASSAATAINYDFNQISGQRFRDQKEESGTFAVTGQKDVVQKANGTITIFNKSFAAQRLVATTRFKSPAGLIFRIPQTIIVPPAAKTGTATVPGSIISIIYADKPGAEYNIAPTQFTIPGLEGTPKFSDFYAVSDKPMTGGIIGPAKVVTEKDFAGAQEMLAVKVKDEVLRLLKSQAGGLKIPDAIAVKLEVPATNAKVGDAVDNLQMSIKGSADTVAFRESDVMELIKNFVSKKDGLELLSKDLTVNYANPTPSTDNSQLSFNVQVSGWAAAKLNPDAIKQDIGGMGEDAVRSYFKGVKEIESARIILSPFWVRNIPKEAGKIKVDIQN